MGPGFIKENLREWEIFITVKHRALGLLYEGQNKQRICDFAKVFDL